MRFLAPFCVVFFATVVYSKKWREYGYRECCSCDDRETPNNKWTVTKKEIQKAEKGGEGGGGGEEEGGGGSRGLKKDGAGEDGKDGGGEGEEEDSKRRRLKKVPDGGSQEEGAKGRRSKKGRTDASEEEGRKRRRPKKVKGGGSEEEDTKRRKSKKGRGEGSGEEGSKRRKSKKGRGEGSEEEGSKRRKSKKGRGEGSEEEGTKHRKSKKGRGEGSEEEGTTRPSRKKGKGGGGEEGGAKPPGAGETGGSKGGHGIDGYMYHEGVVSGDEPLDFEGDFTPIMRKIQRQVLKRHNRLRKKHGVPPLEHSEEMCRHAQAYAYRLAQMGKMKHRTHSRKYGENLFASWDPSSNKVFRGKTAVDCWYDEIKYYTFGNEYVPKAGHFTQLMWKKSRRLGTGIATYKGNTYVVCNYDPSGNVIGGYSENVPKPGSPYSEREEGGSKGHQGGGGKGHGGGGGEGEEEGENEQLRTGFEFRDGVISGDDEPEDFNGRFTKSMRKLQRQVLLHHNRLRRRHGVPPVENDDTISRYAQAYAYALARLGKMRHRSRNRKYGENIWSSYGTDHDSLSVTGKNAVNCWYDEIKMYKWGNTFQPACGHFTQVVWKDCTKIGSGVAKYKNKIFVVTNYSPAGNVENMYLKNVPRPGSPPSKREGEGGGKGHGGGAGEGEGGKGHRKEKKEGGGRKDDYMYRSGLISGDDEPDDFNGEFTKAQRKIQRQVLRRHNKWRKLHGVPPVENDEKIARYAQAYAYSLARQGKMKHRSRNKKYGENLFMNWNSSPEHHIHGKRAVDNWYDEIKMYHWGNTWQPACGHFTQVVWRTARKIGTGIAKYNHKIFVVTNYYPPGNMMGHFKENVPRPGSPPSGGGEGGGKGHGGGGGGGGGEEEESGGGKKDDYMYHEGVIRGIEPTDFNGKFTKAMRRLQKQVLKVSNKYRRMHGVPPLEHSEQMCHYAQAYAFYLAKIGKMVHRSRNKKYGENLFYGWSMDPAYHVHGRRAVDGWYDEIKLHRWTNAFQFASGHFTQLIWKSSRYLGSGIAKYNNKIFIVSNYDPPGNVHGLFFKNVPRPRK
ncbi:uncharacterized protein LOC144158330 [Haemaphysalis longicornis]